VKQLSMTVAIAGLVWAAGSPQSAAGTPAQDIESASSVFFSEGHDSSRAAAQEALSNLVDSASRIAVDAGLPAAARERLAVAAAAYAAGGFLEPDSVAAVHRAYEAVGEGRAFVFPRDVGSIEGARTYGRGQIRRALAALDAGQATEAIQEVLGFVLLVTTPMEKPE
jgi:hypothetical protein